MWWMVKEGGGGERGAYEDSLLLTRTLFLEMKERCGEARL